MSDIPASGIPIVSPLTGEVIELPDVPDPVFSSKVMGEGFGIKPLIGEVLAPADAEVVMVAETEHAIAFKMDSGLEILLHLGINTVELKGGPFHLNVSAGDRVRAGETIGTMDLAGIAAAGKKTESVLVFTNGDECLSSLDVKTGLADAGGEAARVTLKGAAAKAQAGAKSAQVRADDAADGTDVASAHTVNGSASPGAGAPKTEGTNPMKNNALSGPNKRKGKKKAASAEERAELDAAARDIVEGVGGAGNIRKVIHCITRLRFYLKDEALADDSAVIDIDEVIDVARAAGQYQVVIGPKVGQVYEAIVKLLPRNSEDDVLGGEEERERPTTPFGWVKYGFSSLIGVITGSMIPIIGVLAAAGILGGLLTLCTELELIDKNSDTKILIGAMASAVFHFLPIIVGFTAARRLGANPIIVAIIGGVLCFPALVTLSDPTRINLPPDQHPYHVVARLGGIEFNAEFFGIPVALPTGEKGMAYTSTIFPIIIAAWLASKLEPWLKRWIPAVIHSMFAPLVEIFVVSSLVLVVFGPLVMILSGFITNGINSIIDYNYIVAGLVIGGLYQTLVIFGLHWAVIPVIAAQLSNGSESSRINAIVSVTMIAQGAGALAIWVKSKNPRIKQIAGPATISAMCGVTEPAMYGLNLKYGRAFITASIGGAVGGLVTGLLNVNMWGFTGAFIGFPSFINKHSGEIDASFTGFWIASLVTLVVGFLLTYLFGFKDSDLETERKVKKVRLGRREPVAK